MDLNVTRQGIASNWPSRRSVIRSIESTKPWSMESAIAYNERRETLNKSKSPPGSAYTGVGSRLLRAAEALALKGEPWEQQMVEALGYLQLAAKLNYFWHVQFRRLALNPSQPLRLMSWKSMTEAMAMLFALGRLDEGIYEGYLIHSALNNTFQVQKSYENEHRRVHAFMLRLFAAWRGDVNHAWPPFAFDEPIYEGILARWRDPDPKAIEPWLLAACDRHTHQSKRESEKVFRDCADFPRTPSEILLVLRLRKMTGLEIPSLDHPLMEPPFDRLPELQQPYIPDTFVQATLRRIREDWPEFDRIVSLEALRAG
jgi:hypothetical protein